MQHVHQISLNTLRAFVVAAQHLSFKEAGAELGVTPGAVSHQIKSLEARLGAQLFSRSNNAIALTDAGRALFERSQPGLFILDAALGHSVRDSNELTIKVSTTLALRWLVPRLAAFRAQVPQARIKVETLDEVDAKRFDDADVAIAYHRHPTPPDGAPLLLPDVCRPYVAPALLHQRGSPTAICDIPAIQTAASNWDWALWQKKAGLDDAPLQFAARFDLDDAAQRAAIAGLGMILAADFMVARDVEDGTLCAVPGVPAVPLGCYALHIGRRDTALTRSFVRWLERVAADALA